MSSLFVPSYVVKEWTVQPEPAPGAPYVVIKGRAPGLISWVMSLMGLEATATFVVTEDCCIHEHSSLFGSSRRVIPLNSVSSTVTGYRKPVEYLILAAALCWTIVPPIILVVMYFLNKTLTVGIVERAGIANIIQFKRSVIEGQNIDEASARHVTEIVDWLTRVRHRQLTP